MKAERVTSIIWLLPAALLLLALAPLPYGYYTLLRIVVCVAAGLICYVIFTETEQITGWLVAFAVIAFVFNPIVPIRLTRAIWSFLNVVSVGTFITHLYLARRSPR